MVYYICIFISYTYHICTHMFDWINFNWFTETDSRPLAILVCLVCVFIMFVCVLRYLYSYCIDPHGPTCPMVRGPWVRRGGAVGHVVCTWVLTQLGRCAGGRADLWMGRLADAQTDPQGPLIILQMWRVSFGIFFKTRSKSSMLLCLYRSKSAVIPFAIIVAIWIDA